MTVRIYKSTDGSAPTLNGTAGALCTVLDAVLVNGYGSQTAAGWTIAYTGTSLRAYRMATSGNTGFYLDVNDAAPATAKEARVRGYETMSALSTGTGPFPTAAQSTNGIFLRKSTTADSTARAWTIIADGSVFYMFIESGDQVNPTWALAFMFGDFFSYKASDAYRCAIIGRVTENSATLTVENFLNVTQGLTANHLGHYIARSFTGVAGSIGFVKQNDMMKSMANSINSMTAASVGYIGAGDSSANAMSVSSIMPYPNPVDNGLYMSPVWLLHSNALRGYLKGIWSPCAIRPLGHADTFSGSGSLSGKSFIVQNVPVLITSTIHGQVFIETSDTWS